MIVVGGDRRVPSRSADRPARPVHDAVARATCVYARWSRRSRSPGSRRPPTSRPTSSGAPGDLRRVVGARRAAGAAALRGDGGDRADGGAGGAGPRRARDRARRAATSRSRCSGWCRASTRPGSADVMQMGGRARRARGADLGGEHLDARPVAARLHAGDQPPDPELARQARPPHPTPYIAIWIAAVIAARAGGPGGRRAARRHLRVRGHARDRDRAHVGDPAALHRSRPRAPVPDPVQRRVGHGCRSRR